MEQLNPLNIPLILVLIFNELKFEDKKNFMRVCKTWRDSVLASWRYVNTVLVVGDKFGTHRLRNLVVKLQRDRNIGSRFYAIQDKPHKSIRLLHSQIPLSDEYQFENRGEYNSPIVWNSFFNWNATAALTSLSLDACTIYTRGSVLDGFRLLLAKFDNLASLELSLCVFRCGPPVDAVNGVVTRTPTLRSLIICTLRYYAYPSGRYISYINGATDELPMEIFRLVPGLTEYNGVALDKFGKKVRGKINE